MIITLEGTNGLNNNAVFLATALSALSVLKRGRKVLVLQLMNRTDINVENYLIGKQLENITLDESVISLDQGIDALMMHIEGGKISSSVFTECTRSMIAQKTNLYDVASSSKRMDFEDEFLDNKLKFKDFFDSAQNSYHLVFVLLPTNNAPLCEEVLKFSDMNIVSIHQGPKEPYLHADNNLFACVNFDRESKYNEKFLAKAYGQKRIYYMPDCTGFKDAITDGVALKFMQINCENEKNDVNHYFNKCLNEMLDAILGKDTHFEDIPEIPDKEREEDFEYQKDQIREDEIVEKQSKRGMRRAGMVVSIKESGDGDIKRVRVKKTPLDERNEVIYDDKIPDDEPKNDFDDMDDLFADEPDNQEETSAELEENTFDDFDDEMPDFLLDSEEEPIEESTDEGNEEDAISSDEDNADNQPEEISDVEDTTTEAVESDTETVDSNDTQSDDTAETVTEDVEDDADDDIFEDELNIVEEKEAEANSDEEAKEESETVKAFKNEANNIIGVFSDLSDDENSSEIDFDDIPEGLINEEEAKGIDESSDVNNDIDEIDVFYAESENGQDETNDDDAESENVAEENNNETETTEDDINDEIKSEDDNVNEEDDSTSIEDILEEDKSTEEAEEYDDEDSSPIKF